jgi:hypothetical protein
MNELEFKRHLKAMVHGHHHPEEHDWDSSGKPQKKAAASPSHPKRRVAKKSSKRK